MLELETAGILERRGGELHYLDLTTMPGAARPA